jgi:hypothetical protein
MVLDPAGYEAIDASHRDRVVHDRPLRLLVRSVRFRNDLVTIWQRSDGTLLSSLLKERDSAAGVPFTLIDADWLPQ